MLRPNVILFRAGTKPFGPFFDVVGIVVLSGFLSATSNEHHQSQNAKLPIAFSFGYIDLRTYPSEAWKGRKNLSAEILRGIAEDSSMWNASAS